MGGPQGAKMRNVEQAGLEAESLRLLPTSLGHSGRSYPYLAYDPQPNVQLLKVINFSHFSLKIALSPFLR